MYTIDASVWISSFDPLDPSHLSSRELTLFLRDSDIPVFVPNLVFVEITGAIRRRTGSQGEAEIFAESVRGSSNLAALPLDEIIEQQASRLAAEQALRGADAVYAAVAFHYECTLISLDNEHLTRLVGVVETRTPTALMAELTPPQEQSQ